MYSNRYQRNKESTMVIRSEDNPYLKKEGRDWAALLQGECLLRKSMHVSQPMTPVLGAVCGSPHSCYQEWVRNRGFMRHKRHHAGILLLNVRWQHSSNRLVKVDQSWPYHADEKWIYTLIFTTMPCSHRAEIRDCIGWQWASQVALGAENLPANTGTPWKLTTVPH